MRGKVCTIFPVSCKLLCYWLQRNKNLKHVLLLTMIFASFLYWCASIPFFPVQVFLSMLVKATFLDLPLWHRILVLEILRVIITFHYYYVHVYVWQYMSLFSTSFQFTFLWSLVYVHWIGILCRGKNITDSFPELWYVRLLTSIFVLVMHPMLQVEKINFPILLFLHPVQLNKFLNLKSFSCGFQYKLLIKIVMLCLMTLL